MREAGPQARPAALLVSSRFGPLFWTQFLSAFNDNALKNALVLMIAYRPEVAGSWSPGIVIPLAGGLFILPYFLCSATAGMLADTADKSRLAQLIKFVEIFVMLAAALAVLLGHAGWILALLFAMGIEAAFFGPLKYAILPDLLAPDALLLGNALVEAGTFLAILLGTIAGMLIAGEHGGRIIAVLIVAVAIGAWLSSRRLPPVPPSATGRADWNLFAATARLIGQAAREEKTWRSMLGISWFWLVGAMYLSQFPTYVRFVLGCEEAVVTLFLAVFSVGIAVGSLLCNKVLRGKVSPRTVPWGALGMGVLSLDLYLASPAPAAGPVLVSVGGFLATPAGWRIVADLFGIALFGGVFVVPLYAILQVASDEAVRAQTIAANNVVNAAAMVVAAVVTAALIWAGLSVPGLFVVAGGATLLVAYAFWLLAPSLTVEGEGR